MADRTTEPTNNGDSDSDVQEIEPPVYCCVQREKDVAQEFLGRGLIAASVVVAQGTKKTDEVGGTVPDPLPQVQAANETANKEVPKYCIYCRVQYSSLVISAA
jgi:hypothetical protein